MTMFDFLEKHYLDFATVTLVLLGCLVATIWKKP